MFRIDSSAFRLTLLLAIGICASVPRWSAGQDIVADNPTVDFAREIKPIFEQACLSCHGPDEQEGDFRIDDSDLVMNYIDAGQAKFSDLYLHLLGEEEHELMPPEEEGGPLAADQIEKIRQWIDAGALWPASVKIEKPAPEVEEKIQKEIQQKQEKKDQESGSMQLVWEIVGLLHPVLLHFPVALLIGGALFALFGLRGESPLSDAAYYCLWLAAWMSILACVSGWSFAIDKGYVDWKTLDFNKSIDVHRWGGILVAVLSFFLALVACSSRRRDPYGSGLFWKFCLILLAVLTGFVAHHGGKMTHTGLHDKLQRKTGILYDNLTGGKPAAAPVEKGDDGPAVKPPAQEPAEGTGETSDDKKGEDQGRNKDKKDDDG
jgi:uncharacterized membrane protein